MAPSHQSSKKSRLRSFHYASQLIFYAGKYPLMRPANLIKIGKSYNFDRLFLAVCRDEPKTMKALMQEGEKACKEGERETVETKRQRKKVIEERIKLSNKRQKRNAAGNACLVFSKGTTKLSSTYNAAGNEGRSDASGSDISDDEAEQQDDEDAPQEEDDDETGSDTQAKSEHTHMSQEPDEPTSAATHERQLALLRGEPLRIDDDHCRTTLAAKFTATRTFDINAEFEAVLENCVMKLDPDSLQETLVEYLRNRLETAGPTNPPVVTSESSTEEILEILYVLNRISEDAVIRCASAQIMLYLSIQRQSSGSSNTRTHLNILRTLATKKAGNVSDKESRKVYKAYERDYYNGKKWLDIVEMFGDDGIVILFVVAGKTPKFEGRRRQY